MKVVVTGATGMVGEGVVHECINDNRITDILLINRRPSGIKSKKIKEIIHKDFFDLTSLKAVIEGYDACFYCLGISSVGMKEEAYHKITYDLAVQFGKMLLTHNPKIKMIYVSGAGTDSTEKGRSMWARVKGKAENKILNMGFEDAYAFRPGYIIPTKGLKRTQKAYKYLNFLSPVLRALFPKYVTSLAEIGRAMINVASESRDKKVLECRDIVLAARK